MKISFLINMFALFILSSCNPQEGGIRIEKKKTDLPVKFSVGYSNKDSSRIRIYVPQELRLTNLYPNEIQHSKTYVSITGANISDSGKNPLYQMADSLVRLPEKNYKSGEGMSYAFYAGYMTIVNNSERDSLVANGTFAQFKFKRKVYDLGGLEESSSYLNRKVPDSLKGFLHLDFYNFNTRLRFVENVPIQFR